jgi:hypothetical protein
MPFPTETRTPSVGPYVRHAIVRRSIVWRRNVAGVVAVVAHDHQTVIADEAVAVANSTEASSVSCTCGPQDAVWRTWASVDANDARDPTLPFQAQIAVVGG